MKALERKIPPVFVFTVFAALMWTISNVTPQIDLLGAGRWFIISIPTLIGAVVGLAGVAAFRKAGTTLHPMNADSVSSLVTGGIYRYSRNPMYLGLLCGLVSWALYLSGPWALVGCFLFAAYMNRFQIIPEERAMLSLFGDEFATYCNRVRRWV